MSERAWQVRLLRKLVELFLRRALEPVSLGAALRRPASLGRTGTLTSPKAMEPVQIARGIYRPFSPGTMALAAGSAGSSSTRMPCTKTIDPPIQPPTVSAAKPQSAQTSASVPTSPST